MVDGEGNIRDFDAHKPLLACISDVFSQRFYGASTKVAIIRDYINNKAVAMKGLTLGLLHLHFEC